MRGLPDLVGTLNLLLPTWAVAIVLLLLGLAISPMWIHYVRSKQIRGLVRRMVRADEAERQLLVERAMALTANKGQRLLVVATEAHKMGQVVLRNLAMAQLEQMGGQDKELALLRELVKPTETPVTHPLEAAVVIERLLEEGVVRAAHEHLGRALRRFPGDERLLELRSDIEAALSAAGEDSAQPK
ncbi:MAG: hypothetical protein HN348_06625 [Proteobacteria bacterium]|nr:hypothetical protein [Pseudomonadota bacterium]